jgi:hypothetical protein
MALANTRPLHNPIVVGFDLMLSGQLRIAKSWLWQIAAPAYQTGAIGWVG